MVNYSHFYGDDGQFLCIIAPLELPYKSCNERLNLLTNYLTEKIQEFTRTEPRPSQQRHTNPDYDLIEKVTLDIDVYP